MHRIRLIISPNLNNQRLIEDLTLILVSYHLDEKVMNEVRCKDIEFYQMLTNLNENQYQEQSNIDPMTK